MLLIGCLYRSCPGKKMIDYRTILECTDFLAGVFIQNGNYLKIRKLARGWLFSMIAIAYWVIRAQTTGFQSQMFWHIVSFCMAFYGFRAWIREAK